MSFDKLLEELETLQKAIPADEGAADDERIEAAAAEGNPDADGDGLNDVTGQAVDAEDADVDDEKRDGEGEGEGDEVPMGKSFSLKLDDGTEIEAVDGTQLVKSLMARVEASEEQAAKGLEMAVSLLKQQGEMIKSLQGQVAKLANEGRGRKTVVSIAEKKSVAEPLQKSQSDEGIPVGEFMAKCLSLQAAGKLTGLDVARAESALNKGLPVPADIMARVTQQ